MTRPPPTGGPTDPKRITSVVPRPVTGAYLNFEDAFLGPRSSLTFNPAGVSLLYRLGRTLFLDKESNERQSLTLKVFERHLG